MTQTLTTYWTGFLTLLEQQWVALLALLGIFVAVLYGLRFIGSVIKGETLSAAFPQDQFNIVILQLENDRHARFANMLSAKLQSFANGYVTAVGSSLPGITVTQVTLKLSKNPQTQIQQFLKKTGCHAVIWGGLMNQCSPSLHWSTQVYVDAWDNQGLQLADLRLPDLNLEELLVILQALIAVESANLLNPQAAYPADQIRQCVKELQTLTEAGLNKHGWNQLAYNRARHALANCLNTFGKHTDNTVALAFAVSIYQTLLQIADKSREAKDRAILQNSMGVALWGIGLREFDQQRLQQAIAAYKEASSGFRQQKMLIDWAFSQNNLGNAYAVTAERQSGTADLQQAILAYHSALTEITRDKFPLLWASVHNNLGNSLNALGQRQEDAKLLQQAVTAYHAALDVFTAETVPLQWAAAQNNLGNVYYALGEKEQGLENLLMAVSAYKATLAVYTQDSAPSAWAMAQCNLGTALRTLAGRVSGTDYLQQAIAAYQQALTLLSRETQPEQWAAAQNNLGNALILLGERSGSVSDYLSAVNAYQQALVAWTQETAPMDWAMAQKNLGNALCKLAQHETDTTHLVQAVQAYRAALTQWNVNTVPADWVNFVEASLQDALLLTNQRYSQLWKNTPIASEY